jgi:pyrroline-5-carboxylate reductase
MPNTPALLGSGATALYANDSASHAHRETAETVLRSVGLTVWLDNESLMDVVTALSGSGPAYFFMLMEVMERAATGLGLPVERARVLTVQTAFGAAKMALELSADAATLRAQVTSPGGTTEQALRVLQEGGLDDLVGRAIASAVERSKELSRQFGT